MLSSIPGTVCFWALVSWYSSWFCIVCLCLLSVCCRGWKLVTYAVNRAFHRPRQCCYRCLRRRCLTSSQYEPLPWKILDTYVLGNASSYQLSQPRTRAWHIYLPPVRYWWSRTKVAWHTLGAIFHVLLLSIVVVLKLHAFAVLAFIWVRMLKMTSSSPYKLTTSTAVPPATVGRGHSGLDTEETFTLDIWRSISWI